MEHTVNTVHKFNLTRGVSQKFKNIYFIVFTSLIDLLISPRKTWKWHFQGPKNKKIFSEYAARRLFHYSFLCVPNWKNHATPQLAWHYCMFPFQGLCSEERRNGFSKMVQPDQRDPLNCRQSAPDCTNCYSNYVNKTELNNNTAHRTHNNMVSWFIPLQSDSQTLTKLDEKNLQGKLALHIFFRPVQF